MENENKMEELGHRLYSAVEDYVESETSGMDPEARKRNKDGTAKLIDGVLIAMDGYSMLDEQITKVLAEAMMAEFVALMSTFSENSEYRQFLDSMAKGMVDVFDHPVKKDGQG